MSSPGNLMTSAGAAAATSTSSSTTSGTDATTAGVQAGLERTNIEATGYAKAQTDLATGYQKESDAYLTAGSIAKESANIAQYAGDVLRYQTQLDSWKSAGEAIAGYGASGAAYAGSAIDVLRSTYQQGALATQLVDLQTQLDIAGYLEEQGSLKALQAGADAQSKAATDLADTYTKEANQATTQLAETKTKATTTSGGLSGGQILKIGVGYGVKSVGGGKLGTQTTR